MQYHAALIALENPSDVSRQRTFSVFHTPQGAAGLRALEPLQEQVAKGEHSSFPETLRTDSTQLIAEDATLEDLGNYVRYSKTEAVFVATPTKVHLYAVIGVDCDVISPLAYGAEIDIYDEDGITPPPIKIIEEAEPIDSITYETFEKPFDELDDLKKQILVDHSLYIVGIGQLFAEQVKSGDGLEDGQFKTFEDGIRTRTNHGLHVKYKDPMQFADYRPTAGLLVHVPYNESTSTEEIYERYGKIRWRIADLRTQLGVDLWHFREEPNDLSEEEFLTEFMNRRDDASLKLVKAVTNEYGAEIAPWSPQPYGEHFRTVTNTPTEAFKLNGTVSY